MKTINKTLNFDGRRIKTVCEIFDSPTELIEVCKSRKCNFDPYNDYFGDARGTKSWNDFDDPAGMFDLLVNGTKDEALVGNISKNAVHVNRLDVKKHTQFFNSVQGYSPVVPLVIMGVPNNMINSRMTKMKNRVINLVWDCSIMGSVTPAQVKKVSTEVLKQVVGLELAGYRVRITAVDSYCRGGRSYMMGLKIKDESQPMNLKRILFPCTSPAFVRGVSFGWYVRLPDAVKLDGYGKTAYTDYGKAGSQKYYEQLFGANTVSFSIAEFLYAGSHLEEAVRNSLTVKEVEA